MLDKIFAPGQRKIVVFLIGVALTLFGDKLGLSMTDDNQTAILALVGIFTGGNVLSKFAGALLKGAPLVQGVLPLSAESEEVNMSVDSQLEPIRQYAAQIAQDATAEFNKVHGRCKAIEDHVAKQSKSINDLIQMVTPVVNAMKKGNPPTPNDLYNQG